ncbi:MAG TPA: cobyric acid synthase [Actinocrinis sp.]|nr:cobyric acid synthase [Actinocrinis sp.]
MSSASAGSSAQRTSARGGALLVAGTTSDAGKSVITAAICRWLARQGVRVAPFKAQNMSNNSAVCVDPGTGAGAEIGRAQAMQAAAAGAVPEPAMNPILLKPGGDRSSQVVVLGRPLTEANAQSYQALKKQLLRPVLDAFDDLRSRYDVVVCEGAGSPTEINLREGDLANLGLASARNLPTVVVGDIDRGGVFAAFHGTVALLDAADQSLISGFVVNRFRGDPALLEPGLRMIEGHTGRPVLGVLPYLRDIWLDAEDSLTLEGRPQTTGRAEPYGREPLSVTVVQLPRVSNFTDVDALMLEPGVEVSFTTGPRGIAEADLVVLPGTKATVSDLTWLRERAIAEALAARVARGGAVLGICGGYQMLGKTIDDPVESRSGRVEGLGLLPVATDFAPDKTLARPTGSGLGEPVTTGYEIHHGLVSVHGGESLFTDAEGKALDGCVSGNVIGTLWHGTLESDDYRRAFLQWTAQRAGRSFTPHPHTDFAAARQQQYDRLADALAEHVDTDALWRLIENGPTPGLRLLPPGA